MLLAVFGDIHGNLPAFEAVLHDIDAAGIQTIVNTGDAVVGHPWSNEVVQCLRARNAISVQGETDRLAAWYLRKLNTLKARLAPHDFEALRQAYEGLRSDNLVYLRTLPKQRTLCVEGVTIFLCHGSPNSRKEGIYEDASLAKFRRWREAANAQVVLSGRTHRPFARQLDDTLFVNPGSVGVPGGEALVAQYAVVSTEQKPWAVEHRTVEYPIGRYEWADGTGK